MRVRFIYSKRGGACFVPHIALAQLFSRSAVRAGLEPVMTQGFSPRAKISFGPELPAGVVALKEPVDMYFNDGNDEKILQSSADINREISSENLNSKANLLLKQKFAINLSLPEGFKISQLFFPEESSPAIGKLCTHAEYIVRTRFKLTEYAKKFFGDEMIICEEIDDWLRFIIKAPAQHPIGGFVKFLKGENAITGWHEINIVRAAIGQFNGEKIFLS